MYSQLLEILIFLSSLKLLILLVFGLSLSGFIEKKKNKTHKSHYFLSSSILRDDSETLAIDVICNLVSNS